MKSLLSILLAMGIASLAYANEEKRPEPRAPEARTTQEGRRATQKILVFFFAPAIQIIVVEPGGPCDGKPTVCPTLYGCSCDIGPGDGSDGNPRSQLPPSNPPPE
jgi:hypothetical protein